MQKTIEMAKALIDGMDIAISELYLGADNLIPDRFDHYINDGDQMVVIYHDNPECDLDCDPEESDCMSVLIKAEFIDGRAKIVYGENFKITKGGIEVNWQPEFLKMLDYFVLPHYEKIKAYQNR